MEFRIFLVPIDFSSSSSQALDTAMVLARQLGARLQLVHAYQINTSVYPYGMIIGEDVEKRLREAAQEKLEEWCERAVAGGVEAEAVVVPGTPSEAIAQMAANLPADLIVMGTRGLSGLKHVMLGSVAERTLRTAPCPVLTVRDPEA